MSNDGLSDRPDKDADRPPEDRPAREPADSRVPEPAKAETRSRQEYFEAINSASSQDVIIPLSTCQCGISLAGAMNSECPSRCQIPVPIPQLIQTGWRIRGIRYLETNS